MSGGTPKKPARPIAGKPRKGKRREDQGNVSVTPINPPAVGGGSIPREDGPQGPKKK
jgi:hypothetical protein